MGGREYFEIVTIDDVSIYSTASQPAFVAAQGSLAMRTDVAQLWQNTDGNTTWVQIGSGGASDSLLLIVPIAGTGTVSAPAVDPSGLTNLCYVPAPTVTEIEAMLPLITPSLSSTWRFTMGGGLGASCFLYVFADVGNTMVNVGGSFVEIADYTEGTSSTSGTFVHDGDESWALFAGGAF